jgi:energy-coupling factor transporter ATP-binding protein EcfA2
MTGFEPLIASAVSGLAVPIYQSLSGGSEKFFGMFARSFNDNTKRIIFDASHQYEINYKERHGLLKVLGMNKPVELESVYTSIQFLDKNSIRRFESIEDLEKSYRQVNLRSFEHKDCPKKPGVEVANQEQFLMVLGSPGMGKSTFLKKMGLEALNTKNRKLKHKCIPVFLELKNFTSTKLNFVDIIAEEFKICGFPEVEKFVPKALEQGKLLILLDGLDEAPTSQINEVITKIQDFVDKYKNNRFIASCRIAAYQSTFRRFTDVAMSEFDDAQIQQFINNWFQSDEDKHSGTAQNCWKVLQNPEYAAAKELAQTPLLLTLLCLVYNDSQSFPKNRATLYDEALDVLLKKWASEKRIQRDPIHQDLNPSLEEAMLAEIAYTGFKNDRLFFSEREVVEKIKTFLEENLNAPTHLDGKQILKAIEVQQGILVERAKDAYSFSHLTFQEYLTAKYIDDNRLIPELVTKHLTEHRWREVFLLVAGLMRSGVDELLLLMEKESQKFINTPKLQEWLRWADTSTDSSDGNIKPVGKRAIAITNAIANANAYAIVYDNTYVYVHANANANANANAYVYANGIAYVYASGIAYAINNAIAYAINNDDANPKDLYDRIAKTIDVTNELRELKIFKSVDFSVLITKIEKLKNSIPDENQPQTVRKAFAEELAETFRNAFNLNQQLLELSPDETKALENYLYANSLMLQCKESAVRGSRTTWEAIESRMLLLPRNP